jgi:hypothetical protein
MFPALTAVMVHSVGAVSDHIAQVPRCLRCHSDAGQSSFCLAVKLLKVLIRCHAICTEVPGPLYFGVVLLLAYIMTPCQSHFIARRIGGGIVIRDVRTYVRSDNCKIILHCLNTCIATHTRGAITFGAVFSVSPSLVWLLGDRNWFLQYKNDVCPPMLYCLISLYTGCFDHCDARTVNNRQLAGRPVACAHRSVAIN